MTVWEFVPWYHCIRPPLTSHPKVSAPSSHSEPKDYYLGGISQPLFRVSSCQRDTDQSAPVLSAPPLFSCSAPRKVPRGDTARVRVRVRMRLFRPRPALHVVTTPCPPTSSCNDLHNSATTPHPFCSVDYPRSALVWRP